MFFDMAKLHLSMCNRTSSGSPCTTFGFSLTILNLFFLFPNEWECKKSPELKKHDTSHLNKPKKTARQK